MHRLDRNTSGAVIVARTADSAAWLSRAFRAPAHGLLPAAAAAAAAAGPTTSLPPQSFPAVEKHYQAVVESGSALRDRGLISGQLSPAGARAAAQLAVTKYEVLARSREGFAWLALQPVTGTAPYYAYLLFIS